MTEKFTHPVLVVLDQIPQPDGSFLLTDASVHLLGVARRLTSAEIWAVSLNPSPNMSRLGEAGVSKVLIPNLAGRSPRVSAVVADAVVACANSLTQLSAILCISNFRGREIASMVGAKFRSGAAVEVTEVDVVDGVLTASKSVLGGEWSSSFNIPSGLPIVALRPGAGTAVPVTAVETPGVIPVEVSFSAAADDVRVLSSEVIAESGPSLAEASTVVCAGYGTDGDLDEVKELAELLNGAVGATRPVCDEGWMDRSAQVGQTGLTISPDFYLGVGVSGAIHHTCGMQSSKNIAVVVDDPDVPMVEMADFAVIGDFREILPQAIEALKANPDFQRE
ncbi:electron transfer flavoprotein subunit alpha/FixB family protein [Boudabousia marimammalium]|uniref:Electron transporter n=1 Tax=Boudabousia marimammalium TaxID=156892 RepID=A0A1Q5PR94_9ACTO|nr:electron transfer flavoprotein subunit alpha/FixB family protein [Boudabousia marimammalium]OKL50148.1 electron transporter [Boudabousia marimammalium]